jgi:maltose alpha-D-glucosyltransferase/alpha-amylase
LGQTLRTFSQDKDSAALETERGTGPGSGDFVILDFEGEPARTLAERRQKQSPLKDVAGMIRSFSYAASAGLERAQSSNRGMEPETARAWVVSWERSVTSEFLRAFGKCIAAKPELLPQKEEAQIVLDAYILEKALYELMYELNNRPQWLRIPLTGILAL